MKIFETTISALARRLDVIPCGQVWDRREAVAFALLVMKSRENHPGLANTASPALYLECFPLATVSILRDFAHTMIAPLQCLADLAKSQSGPLSILLKWILPAGDFRSVSLARKRGLRGSIRHAADPWQGALRRPSLESPPWRWILKMASRARP
ncbi:hypothetical protein RHECNPAF_148007 [Rhizobium etli CNPAF512]|nr:hypothetical protein RHECNPAF_148007 [Rhizobium etli CNPAF512]